MTQTTDTTSRNSQKYIEKSTGAESRYRSIYWDLRFIFHIAVFQTPRVLKKEFLRWMKWWERVLKDDLDGIGETCRLEGCEKSGIALISNDKSWSDGTPVCRRHYLMVKGAIYAIGVAVISGIMWSLYYAAFILN